MKIKIARDELLTGLQHVQGVATRHTTTLAFSAMSAYVLLETKRSGIELVATDLETGIRGYYRAEVVQPGSVVLPAHILYEISKRLTDAEVVITAQANHWVQIEADRSRFKIAGLPASEFPVLPTIEQEKHVAVSGSMLASLLRKTLFAVGKHAMQYAINGLLLTLQTSDRKVIMRLVGTDGHRLAVAECELAEPGTDLPKEIKAIIPRKAALEMLGLLKGDDGEIRLGLANKNLVTFSKNSLRVTSRVMEGAYPDYERIIPKHSQTKNVMRRSELDSALRRVATLSDVVKMIVQDGSITVCASNPDEGEAVEAVPAQSHGESVTTAFNARYLLDALAVMDGESITLQTSGPMSPCLMQSDDDPGYRYIIMPVRLGTS